MRAIISAIIRALRTAIGVAAAAISAPFRFLFPGGGRGQADIPEVAPLAEIPAVPAVDRTEMYRQVAVSLQTWIAESLLADAPQPLPTKWPRDVKEWAKGLNREECFALVDAPERAIIAHISGLFAIPRVRKLQVLPAAEWPKQAPILDVCSGQPSFLAIASELARR